MRLSRRELLLGASALGLGCTETPPPRGPVPVAETLPGLAASAHRLRNGKPQTGVSGVERVDLLIVGAGAAGVSAAWRVARAGFRGSVSWLELGDRPGGTAAMGSGPSGEFPLGAHYITLPSPEAAHVRLMLQDLGIIQGFDAEGRPRYRETDLCFDPEERLFYGGRWEPGLWPEAALSADDRAQKAHFDALTGRLTQARGADDRPAFAIPIARSSHDPTLRALAEQSFASFLDAEGLHSPALRAWLRYAARDDFGAELHQISAWAGLHYHCARRPDPATPLGTTVLTWPGGNGALIGALLKRVPYTPRLGVLVVSCEPEAEGWRLAALDGSALIEIQAKAVIMALPVHVVNRLVKRPAPQRAESAPWRVVNLHVDRLPTQEGVKAAWDSVIWGAEGLGYVTNTHQTGAFGQGPATLTCYEPLSGDSPDASRAILLKERPQDAVDRVLDDLSAAMPGLRDRVVGAEVCPWGHGTAIPAVGLHRVGALDEAARPLPGLSFASADLSGMSLFEEASFHGCRAAEEVLIGLGALPDPRLADPA
ncbi:FAD-dependent oxidoreductase [Myxococcota bacterium]|nr:FAD-dependent oxidoreductase [Myxococcota bacterium]